MTPRTRTLIQVMTPVVAIVTMMIGLGIGAKPKTEAAIVYGAAPGRPRPDRAVVLAWQVRTFLEDRGVREVSGGHRLTVTAMSGGQKATFGGRANLDGILEVELAFRRMTFGDAIELHVHDDDARETLAHGVVTWGEQPGVEAAHAAMFVRPTKTEGSLVLDVAIDGERLVPGYPVAVWVRARRSEVPDSSVHSTHLNDFVIGAEPEPGASFDALTRPVWGDGWARFYVTAHAHVVGATFFASTKGGARGDGGDISDDDLRGAFGAGSQASRTPERGEESEHEASGKAGPIVPEAEGRWFGSLPVAPGAFFIDVPHSIPVNASGVTATVFAPNARKTVYVEVDDERGRVAARALELQANGPNATPSAAFSLPPLTSGLYRIFASGDPTEGGGGAPLGKTVKVESKSYAPGAARDAGDREIATTVFGPTPRWMALDGFATQSGPAHSRRRLGIALAIAALVIAAAIEVLLLGAAARRAKDVLRAVAEEGGSSTPSGNVGVTVLVVLLGFALLVALILTTR